MEVGQMAGPALACDGCQARSGNIHETEWSEICKEEKTSAALELGKRDRDNGAKR